MKYQVPQFIEVEDKIFGPLTFRQFIYLIGGAGLSLIIYLSVSPISFYLAILLIIPVAAFAVALAFYKVNNKPFIFVVESAITYYFGPKLYIWRKKEETVTKSIPVNFTNSPNSIIPNISNSKLKDMTWSLDTKGTAPAQKPEEE